MVTNLLPFAVILHLVFGMWAMSNETFFASTGLDTSIEGAGNGTAIGISSTSKVLGEGWSSMILERLTHKNCYFAFLIFVLLIVKTLWQVSDRSGGRGALETHTN